MKTKNNVQKAILKSIAVIVSLVLVSFTVNAQDFWKSIFENEAISQIAMAMTAHDSENKNVTKGEAALATTVSAYEAVETEEALKVEDWMLNEANFTAFSYTEETEAPMVVESWMTNKSLFNNPVMDYSNATEAPMQVENWMVNDSLFKVGNYYYTENVLDCKDLTEPKLVIEKWMVNSKVWN